MKHFDQFAGVGGFTLGLKRAYEIYYNQQQSANTEQADRQTRREWDTDKRDVCVHTPNVSSLCYENIGFSEIDRSAVAIYRYQFPRHKNYGNTTRINPTDIGEYDLLSAGFPCQSFSIAGKRKGFMDKRGNLFFEIVRFLDVEQRPRHFLLENVEGIYSADGGKVFTTILRYLTDLGYRVEIVLLNSKHFGVPQNRRRVFFIGHLRGECEKEILSFKKTIKDTSKGIPKQALRGRDKNLSGCLETKVSRFKSSLEKYIFEQDAVRYLTPLEYERLQGFPDSWTKKGFFFEGAEEEYQRLIGTMSDQVRKKSRLVKTVADTGRYKCVGNAVTVNVIEAIGLRMLEQGCLR